MANNLGYKDQDAIQAEKELGVVKELDALIQANNESVNRLGKLVATPVYGLFNPDVPNPSEDA